MVRKGRYRYECTDCGGLTNPLDLMRLGGKVRPDFRARDGHDEPAVKIVRVLCFWCRFYHEPAEVLTCMKIPERRAVSANGTGCSSSALEAGLLTQYSELWAFLTGNPSGTGKPRLPGSLSLRLESGLLAVSLTDPETCQYCCLNGTKLDDLLTQLELGLEDGSLPWRPSKYGPAKKR